MGLFSSSSKNRQDRVAEDSGRFYSKDEDAALGERARAKRASNAGGGATRRPGNDPMLPEKKRARRRLVGAIALALAAAVGLPMLLDSEPKPLAGDIAIQIPAKDKAAPLPVPGDKPADKTVPVADSLGKGEEIVDQPPAAKPEPAPVPPPAKPAVTPPPPKPEVAKVETTKPEHKPEHKSEPVKPEPPKAAAKPEHKDKPDTHVADKTKEADKPEKPVKPKAEDKPAKAHDDAARALAILEDKPAESASQKVVVQVIAVSSQEKAAEIQAKLREAGISAYTQKANTSAGELIRIRVGPLSREEAEKVRGKLGKLGMSGTITPL